MSFLSNTLELIYFKCPLKNNSTNDVQTSDCPLILKGYSAYKSHAEKCNIMRYICKKCNQIILKRDF